MEFVYQPSVSARLGDYLKSNFSEDWTHFRAAVAFIKRSGVQHVAPALAEFARTRHVEIIAGIDHQGTSLEGLKDLLGAVSPKGRIVVFHNRLPFTFHPKVYLFKSPIAADVMIGSGNLTEGGLFTNYEAGLRVILDVSDPMQAALLQSIEQVLDAWANPLAGTASVLDDNLLAQLAALNLVPSETVRDSRLGSNEDDGNADDTDLPFAPRTVPRAPSVLMPVGDSDIASYEIQNTEPVVGISQPNELGATGFVMTLQRTDVSVGQITAKASRRSPEIFIPLVARDAVPEFWGWPDDFVKSSRPPHPRSRANVRIRLLGEIVSATIMTWPPKRDFRVRSAALRRAGNVGLRRAGNVGDILRMEKVGLASGYDYDVEVIAQGTSRHSVYLARCRNTVRNSEKKYGYY